MKLVLATPLYPPEIGGPATYAKALYEGLPARGIEVELVKFADIRHLPKFLRHWAYYRRVLRVARGADLILALDPVSVGLPALWAAKKAKKPFAVKIVGDYAWEQGRQRFGVTDTLDDFVIKPQASKGVRFFQTIQTRVARSADKIIVPSDYLKKIISAWGIPESKIEVIYNAVQLEELGSAPTVVANLPRPLVVTAGRLVPWKHIEAVIEAVANLREGGSTASLAIIGDGPLRGSLAQLAKEKLGSAGILTGALGHADALTSMHAADVFVLNSSYEGLSHFLIEALMLGVPTIATNVGGNPEVIQDGQNGLLVPSGDTQVLTSTLTKLLSDTELRKTLSAHAKESSRRFSKEAMLTRTADFLKSLT